MVGIESLSPRERLLLETARSLREDFLHQNAFDPVDTYSTLKKQVYMLKIILEFHHRAQKFIENGGNLEEVLSSPLKEEIARMRYIKNEDEESMKILLEKVSKIFEVVNA